MNITKREFEYLKVIGEITRDRSYASTNEIAKCLNVKEPTVVEAVRRLRSKGYVIYVPRKGSTLTGKGKALLANIERRHRILETILVKVFNLDVKRACLEASRLELHVSDELIDFMCRYLGHPRRCPHGYLIPLKLSCCGERVNNSSSFER